MDKNKNYDLIVSIVTAHPKYIGCESYLEEIVSDVLSRTETVLNSSASQDVLVAYIDKIVTSSIVRICRKNKPSSRAERAININLEKPIVSTTIRPLVEENKSVIKEEIQKEEVEYTYEEEPVLIEENDDDIEPILEQEIIEENTEIIIQESTSQENEEISINLSDTLNVDTVEEFALEYQEEQIIDSIDASSLLQGDSELAEMQEVSNTFERASALLDKIQEENVVLNQETGILSEQDSEISLDLTNIDDIAISFEEEELETTDRNSLEEVLLPVTEVSETTDILDNLEISVDDKLENSTESEEFMTDDLLVFDNAENFNELDVDSSLVLEEVPVDTVEAIEELLNIIKTPLDIYKKFAFSIENIDFELDLSAKQEMLQALDKKYPELNVLEVCELKFHKKMTISEIAAFSKKTEAEIQECLNEIVYAVKD